MWLRPHASHWPQQSEAKGSEWVQTRIPSGKGASEGASQAQGHWWRQSSKKGPDLAPPSSIPRHVHGTGPTPDTVGCIQQTTCGARNLSSVKEGSWPQRPWLYFAHLSKIHPRMLSSGMDRVFSTSISFIIPKCKRPIHISTKMAQISTSMHRWASAQIRWVGFTLQNKWTNFA